MPQSLVRRRYWPDLLALTGGFEYLRILAKVIKSNKLGIQLSK